MDDRSHTEALSRFTGKPPALRGLPFTCVQEPRSVFVRYNIVNEADLELAAGRLQAYINQEKVTLAVTLSELCGSCAEGGTDEVIETMGESLVPPIRIERTTRGLGNRCSIQLSYGGMAEL